jgi:hypothetical protein
VVVTASACLKVSGRGLATVGEPCRQATGHQQPNQHLDQQANQHKVFRARSADLRNSYACATAVMG